MPPAETKFLAVANTCPVVFGFSRFAKLTHAATEAVFLRSVLREGEDWKPAIRERGIRIDLSAVGWVDVTACVHILTVVERALKDGIPRVEVVFPDPLVDGLSENVRLRREIALHRLRDDFHLKFRKALECEHLTPGQRANLDVTDHGTTCPARSDSYFSRSSPGSGVADLSRLYTFLEWLPVDRDAPGIALHLSELRVRLEKVIVNPARSRIIKFDAQAFANILFNEIIDNVGTHAGASHCLVAVWARQSGHLALESEAASWEADFVKNWVARDRLPLVQIIIADSGKGITTELKEQYRKDADSHGVLEGVPRSPVSGRSAREGLKEEEKILFWSMARWSTSAPDADHRKRGTRGLYRVKRLVMAHHGHFAVGADGYMVAWDYGSHSGQHIPVAPKTGTWWPGFMTSSQFVAAPTEPVLLENARVRNVEFVLAPTLHIADSGLDGNTSETIRQMLSADDSGDARCVCAHLSNPFHHRVKNRYKEKYQNWKTAVEPVLAELAVITNPGTLVLCAFDFSPNVLESFADSVNAELSKNPSKRFTTESSESQHPHNPLIILDRDLKIHWVGVCQWEVSALEKIASAENALNRESWQEAYQKVTEDLETPSLGDIEKSISDLSQQTDLFDVRSDGSIQMRFNPAAVADALEHQTRERLNDMVLDKPDSDPRRWDKKWVVKGPFLTKSLHWVDYWISQTSIIEEFSVFQTFPRTLNPLANVLTQPELAALNRIQRDQFQKASDVITHLSPKIKTNRRDEILDTLATPLGGDLLLCALWCKIRDQLFKPDFLVHDHEDQRDRAVYLAECLGIGPIPLMLPEDALTGSHGLWNVVENKRVLIYTDFLASGSTVDRTISRLSMSGGEAIAVVCVVDARPKKESHSFGAQTVPVFSLLEIRDHVKDAVNEMEKQWKSPPGGKKSPEPRIYPLSRSVLIDAIGRTNAACFTHMIRPTGRHTIYDIKGKSDGSGSGIFDDEKFSKDFTEAVRGVLNSHKEFPVDLDDGTWLTLVEGPLLDQNIIAKNLELKSDKILEVNRKRGETSLEFGDNLEGKIRGKRILLFLSYAYHGTSALRFAFQFASHCPKSITVVVLFSRVSPQDENNMRNIPSMVTPDEPATLVFSFLCRGIIPLMHEHECPVCEQRWKIQERSDIPKGQLGYFTEEWIRQIRPNYEENLKQEPGLHARLWDGVDPQLWHSMLSWRSEIEEARELGGEWTDKKNLELARNIQSLSVAATWHRHHLKIAGIVCLLANETSLFWKSPFYLPNIESCISKLALRVLEEKGPSPSASPYTKRMAIICIRSASKKHFAKYLPKIAVFAAPENHLVMQLFYDIQTYVNIHGVRPAYFIDPLLSSLRKIEESRTIQDDGHRELLSQLINFAHRKLISVGGSRDTHYQWKALREILDTLLKNRHLLFPRFLETLESRKLAKNITDEQEKRDYWLAVLEQWQAVWTKIVNEIVPRLEVLWVVLQGMCARDTFGKSVDCFSGFDLVGKLATHNEANAFQSDMSHLLEMAAHDPQGFEEHEAQFDLLCDTLGDILLSYSNGVQPRAKLLQFLHTCPCEPYAVIKTCVASLRSNELTSFDINHQSWSGSVFCGSSALRLAITEVLKNAVEVHRRRDSEVSVHISVDLRDKDGSLSKVGRPCITVLSHGTDPNYPTDHIGKNGISIAREHLESFGGKIMQAPLPDKSWQVMIFLDEFRQLTSLESAKINI